MKNSNKNRRYLLPKFTLVTLCFLLFTNVSFSQKVKDKYLEGKTFTIDLTVQGGKKTPKPEADELSFKTGKFNSKLMKTENGFKAADYVVTVDSSSSEKTFSFDIESKNGDDEVMHWVGNVSGETIEGTATLSKKEKVKKTYGFSGTLKSKKK
jgi:hypothetical protein